MKGSSAVIVSSGGSDESEPVDPSFCGEPALLKYRELRSGRPEILEALDETCDCDCVARALEDRLGSVPAIALQPGPMGARARIRRFVRRAALEVRMRGTARCSVAGALITND